MAQANTAAGLPPGEWNMNDSLAIVYSPDGSKNTNVTGTRRLKRARFSLTVTIKEQVTAELLV